MLTKRFVCMLLLLAWSGLAYAEVTLRVSWERPVQFKVIDAETGEAVANPLLIIKREQREDGSPEPVPYYDVVEGSAAGLAPYQASDKLDGVEVRCVSVGYALLTQQVNWKDLPPHRRDAYGLEIGPVPVIPISLKNLSRSGRWQSNFRLAIAPELKDLLAVNPPFLSTRGKRLVSDFLNREHDRQLGF